MNFIDVAPEALAMFAQAVAANPNVRVIGSLDQEGVCRFELNVSTIYSGRPGQWTCEVRVDQGATLTAFKPCTSASDASTTDKG